MIAWLNPAAFLGLIALAGPIIVHLLRRHRAVRVPFPSLRFVRPSRAVAVRLRLPGDLGLLVIRLLILLAAVAALARPVVLTRWRTDSWNARTARAVVVDVSDSMTRTDAGPPPAAEADDLARTDGADAAWSTRIEARALRSGLQQAVVWLSATAPARREIVLISDFQTGALTERDVALVPAGIGLRLRQTGVATGERRIEGAGLFGTAMSRGQMIVLSGSATAVSLASRSATTAGLQILTTDSDRAAGAALLEIVESAGAPAPAPEQPLVVSFAGATPRGGGPVSQPWMLQTLLRLRADAEIGAAAIADPAKPGAEDPSWQAVVRDGAGRPVVRAASDGSSLMIDVAAPPDSYLAAAVARGALIARHGPMARPEDEVLRLTSAALAKWERPAPPVGPDAWRGTDVSDARWCWAIALVLLCGEAWLRRDPIGALAAGPRTARLGADTDAA